jgi:hypothetical protein
MRALAIVLMLVSLPLFAQLPALDELRYCTTTPARDSEGKIARSSAVLAAFRKVHPCPVTGKSSGPCPGWAIDHVIPLACGGCDAVANLQWLPNEIKSAKGSAKDRWERKIYCHG